MISTLHIRTMARYNRWQNRSLYGAADGLGAEARRADRGAFFRSIEGTLNHLLWADRMWMSRFSDIPKPPVGIADSPRLVEDWGQLKAERAALDEIIITWADGVEEEWLAGELTWRPSSMNIDMRKPLWLVLTHFFNHQTHHRGQVHAMLTAAGAKPEETDLIRLQDLPV